MSYGAYAHTPHLDDHVVKAILAKQQDAFEVDPVWMIILRDLMMGAVAQADVIGVIGLWRPQGPASAEHLARRFLQDHRGISGHWRAMDYMLKLAGQRAFDRQTPDFSPFIFFRVWSICTNFSHWRKKYPPVNFPVIAYEFEAGCKFVESLAASAGNQKRSH